MPAERKALDEVIPVKFWIRNIPEHVPEAANRIASACAKAGLDPVNCHQATVCAVEAINNAIGHAYRDHNGYVAIRWRCTDSSISIEIADQGIGMERDPDAVELAPTTERGRGWHIIRAWMDEAKYERRANENVVTMTKHLPAAIVANRPKTSSGSI